MEYLLVALHRNCLRYFADIALSIYLLNDFLSNAISRVTIELILKRCSFLQNKKTQKTEKENKKTYAH